MVRTFFLILLAGLMLSAVRPAHAEKRVALVIGNGAYRHTDVWTKLDNPPNDASDIAAVLSSLGCELVGGKVLLNLDKAGMEEAIVQFGERLGDGVVGLFYYAGHGLASDKTNYLVPVDASQPSKKTLNIKMVSADLIIDQFPTGGGLNIVILDSCRNTPSSVRGLRGDDKDGLVTMTAPKGILIGYSTQAGNTALDGTGRNSPYAEALKEMMQKPGVGILDFFNAVGVKVNKDTDGKQQPWLGLSPIEGRFQFKPGSAESLPPPPTEDKEALFWKSIEGSTDPAMYDAYLSQYPDGAFAALAKARKAKYGQQVAVASPPVSHTTGPGLGMKNTPSGMVGQIVSLSTLPGTIAIDGEGEHSPYAEALAEHMFKSLIRK